MKKVLWSVSVVIMMLAVGCKDKKSSDSAAGNESLCSSTVLPDSTIYGILGEATGMSCIQLITESGDTLVLNKESEYTGEAGRIVGSIENYSDRFAIVATEDTQSIRIAINLTQLAQAWNSDSDQKNNFTLLPDGTFQSTAKEGMGFHKWSIHNGMLVFHSEKTSKPSSQIEADTLDILKLSNDSLVVMEKNHNIKRFFKAK